MTGILEIKHGPKLGIWVRLADLIQWCIVLIHNLVYGTHHTCIFNRPSQITGRFAANSIGRLFMRDARKSGGRVTGRWARRREEFSYAEVALRRRGEEIVDSVLQGVSRI